MNTLLEIDVKRVLVEVAIFTLPSILVVLHFVK